MRRLASIAMALWLAAAAGACTSANLPQFPAGSASLETGAVDSAQPASAAASYETAVIAPGTPTEVYALVAGGALRCWFGAHGPLKASHVFHAEAAPPSQGGVAEIVLHERDASLRDQRGARAFRVSFTDIAGGVHVGITSIKVAAPLAELMVRDVVVWASGGAGCQTRALSPPPPQAAAPAQKPAKTKASRNGGQ
jgi:hypothetical protein